MVHGLVFRVQVCLTYFCSTVKTFYYPVFKNKDMNSNIIGYLTPLKYVKVYERNDNWIKVDCHYNSQDQNIILRISLIGWCPRSQWNSTTQSDHTYFQAIVSDYRNTDNISVDIDIDIEVDTDSDEESSNISESDLEDNIETYYQLIDESTGYFYYYNEQTGESNWEPPEWIEEFDPISGSR